MRGRKPARQNDLKHRSSMPSAIARAAIAPVHASASVRAEQVTQLVLGESAAITERAGEWRRVCTHSDGYNGWVHAGYLFELDDAQVQEWRDRATGWSEGAVVRDGKASLALPLRARVILQEGAVVLPDGRQGRIADGSIRELAQVIAGARATAPERWALEHFAGSPYQWGGVTPWGVDCSGLVQTTFAARGVVLPRDSAQQAACGKNVALDGIRPGDLLFFRGESGPSITHVAFAGEADTLVHATLACGAMLTESWLPGTRGASLRDRLVIVRRLEER
jgi:gamma-D-glutamyl-L-lysine dipeptidyl-peptidase